MTLWTGREVMTGSLKRETNNNDYKYCNIYMAVPFLSFLNVSISRYELK